MLALVARLYCIYKANVDTAAHNVVLPVEAFTQLFHVLNVKSLATLIF